MLAKEYANKIIYHLSTISSGKDGQFTIEFINSDLSLPIMLKTLVDKYFKEQLINKSTYQRIIEYYKNGVSEEICKSIETFLVSFHKNKDANYLFENAKTILGIDIFREKNIKKGGVSRRKKYNKKNKTKKHKRNKLKKGGTVSPELVDSEDICPICLDNFTNENPKWVLHNYTGVPLLNVAHSFHYECVKQYYSTIQTNNLENVDNILTCPVCRETVRVHFDFPVVRGNSEQRSRYRDIRNSIDESVAYVTGVHLNSLNENQRGNLKRFLLLYYFLLVLLISRNNLS